MAVESSPFSDTSGDGRSGSEEPLVVVVTARDVDLPPAEAEAEAELVCSGEGEDKLSSFVATPEYNGNTVVVLFYATWLPHPCCTAFSLITAALRTLLCHLVPPSLLHSLLLETAALRTLLCHLVRSPLLHSLLLDNCCAACRSMPLLLLFLSHGVLLYAYCRCLLRWVLFVASLLLLRVALPDAREPLPQAKYSLTQPVEKRLTCPCMHARLLSFSKIRQQTNIQQITADSVKSH